MGANSAQREAVMDAFATCAPAATPTAKTHLRQTKPNSTTNKDFLMILYGISNCDTVKKAKNWLDQQHIDYRFHDFRKDGLNAEIINEWLKTVAWDKILNRRSTSWRNLDASVQQSVSETNIVRLLEQNPTLIKRPILDTNGIITIGFNADTYQGILN